MFKLYGFLLFLASLTIARSSFYEDKHVNTVFSVLPGLDIIESDVNQRESKFLDNEIENDNFAFRTVKFLDNHEMRLKIGNIMNSSDVENVYKKVIESFETENSENSGKKMKICYKNINEILTLPSIFISFHLLTIKVIFYIHPCN